MNVSPPGSPMGAHGIDHNQSGSPPPPQLSKRDKRRTMLAERIAEMTARFTSNRDTHYREQLQALQIDMNLIMEADVHGPGLLVDDPAGVDALVKANMEKTGMKAVGGVPPPRAGRAYADYAKGINDVKEKLDASLAMHNRDYDVKMAQINAAHAYRMKVATTEHKALSSTLRDRLINSVTNKKNRLSRDRETVDIAENNALLLHPSQYGHANPASPGGIPSKRATRHRRDPDELPSFAEGSKRKRKAGDSDESPAPTRQRIENGASTPLWLAEKQALIARQIDSPLYSIDKLFTEKELSMTYNTAALAAHSHMQRHPPYADDVESPPNGKSDSSSENEKNANPEVDVEDAESPPGGAMMERQYSHATRSTRGLAGNYVTGLGIDAFSDINIPGNLEALTRQIPKLPPYLAYGAIKVYTKGEASNTPASLGADDIAAELELIRRARQYNDENGIGSNLDLENGGKPLLEMASFPKTFNYWVPSDNKTSYGRREEREEAAASALAGIGGEDMTRQASGFSTAGSDMMGGTPMSRQGTGDGAMSSKGRKITRREH